MEPVLFQTLALMTIAALNALTAWLTYRTRTDVKIIEQSTNSMKDALVLATGVAARAEGKEQGRVEGAAGAAISATTVGAAHAAGMAEGAASAAANAVTAEAAATKKP